MTEEQLSQLLGKPFHEIFYLCHYKEILLSMFGVIYHKGIQQGLKEGHDDANQALKNYNTLAILN